MNANMKLCELEYKWSKTTNNKSRKKQDTQTTITPPLPNKKTKTRHTNNHPSPFTKEIKQINKQPSPPSFTKKKQKQKQKQNKTNNYPSPFTKIKRRQTNIHKKHTNFGQQHSYCFYIAHTQQSRTGHTDIWAMHGGLHRWTTC